MVLSVLWYKERIYFDSGVVIVHKHVLNSIILYKTLELKRFISGHMVYHLTSKSTIEMLGHKRRFLRLDLCWFCSKPAAPNRDIEHHVQGMLLSENIARKRVVSIPSGMMEYIENYPRWRQMGMFSALLAICAGNSPVTGEFPTQRPVTRSFDAFFDLSLNKRLSKPSWSWWVETPSRPLWRHCHALYTSTIVRERLFAPSKRWHVSCKWFNSMETNIETWFLTHIATIVPYLSTNDNIMDYR